MPLVCITAPHFCAGVVVGERAAPIVAYMRTWTLAHILAYCQQKGWQYAVSSGSPPGGVAPPGSGLGG